MLMNFLQMAERAVATIEQHVIHLLSYASLVILSVPDQGLVNKALSR